MKRPFVFGVAYMALSMAIEIVLLIVGRLRIPQDNAIIAPILLIVSPVAAAWMCGYRRPRIVIVLASVTVILTLVLVIVFGRLTGISTGVAAPMVLRTIAGALAAVLTDLTQRDHLKRDGG